MGGRGVPLGGGPAELFAGHGDSLAIYRAVAREVERLGGAGERTTRSQVAWSRRRGFAYAWRPGQYVRSDVPLVLSLALPREVASPRVKEVVHPGATVWVHHVELRSAEALDGEVVALLREAYEAAGE